MYISHLKIICALEGTDTFTKIQTSFADAEFPEKSTILNTIFSIQQETYCTVYINVLSIHSPNSESKVRKSHTKDDDDDLRNIG